MLFVKAHELRDVHTPSFSPRHEAHLHGLRYAVHELPAGVLYGAGGADVKQCAELMNDLDEFKTLCAELDREHSAFIEGCRWHFDHYPHFLGRRRHFASYQQYIERRGGPLRVAEPRHDL